MPGRMTSVHRILSRSAIPSDVAAPQDFTLAPASASAGAPRPAFTLAYCADFDAGRVLFTHHEQSELAALFAAPFLFVEQLRRAACVTQIPFECLTELGLADANMRPLIVFSPGRTGSTLLARLLAAAGLGCASEPDMLTQIARADPLLWAGQPLGMDALLAGTCIGALCRVLGPGAAIKLRGWCNARPLAMVQGFTDCRIVFMLRGMAGWAASRHRAFRESAEDVAAELHRALDALDALNEAGRHVEILWYETLVADPRTALARFDAHVPDDCLECVMREDSQEGSWIARRIVASRPIQDNFPTEFAACWAAHRAGTSWSGWTEALLQQMWDS